MALSSARFVDARCVGEAGSVDLVVEPEERRMEETYDMFLEKMYEMVDFVKSVFFLYRMFFRLNEWRVRGSHDITYCIKHPT